MTDTAFYVPDPGSLGLFQRMIDRDVARGLSVRVHLHQHAASCVSDCYTVGGDAA